MAGYQIFGLAAYPVLGDIQYSLSIFIINSTGQYKNINILLNFGVHIQKGGTIGMSMMSKKLLAITR